MSPTKSSAAQEEGESLTCEGYSLEGRVNHRFPLKCTLFGCSQKLTADFSNGQFVLSLSGKQVCGAKKSPNTENLRKPVFVSLCLHILLCLVASHTVPTD